MPSDATQAAPREIAVVGGGTMGVGIVYVFAMAGFHVHLVEPDASRTKAAFATLRDAVGTASDQARRQKTVDQMASNPAWMRLRACEQQSTDLVKRVHRLKAKRTETDKETYKVDGRIATAVASREAVDETKRLQVELATQSCP